VDTVDKFAGRGKLALPLIDLEPPASGTAFFFRCLYGKHWRGALTSRTFSKESIMRSPYLSVVGIITLLTLAPPFAQAAIPDNTGNAFKPNLSTRSLPIPGGTPKQGRAPKLAEWPRGTEQ
jgi:hypothetical protein